MQLLKNNFTNSAKEEVVRSEVVIERLQCKRLSSNQRNKIKLIFIFQKKGFLVLKATIDTFGNSIKQKSLIS